MLPPNAKAIGTDPRSASNDVTRNSSNDKSSPLTTFPHRRCLSPLPIPSLVLSNGRSPNARAAPGMARTRSRPYRPRLRQLCVLPGRRSLSLQFHLHCGRRPTSTARFSKVVPRSIVRNSGRSSTAGIHPIHGERIALYVVARRASHSRTLDRPYSTPSFAAPSPGIPLGTTTMSTTCHSWVALAQRMTNQQRTQHPH